MYSQVIGRDETSNDAPYVGSMMDMIGSGTWSLADGRSSMAHSAEAVDALRRVAFDTQNASADSWGNWLKDNEDWIAYGATLLSVRHDLVYSDGEVAALRQVARDTQNASADSWGTWWFQYNQDWITGGATIRDVRSGLAHAKEEGAALNQLILDVQGRALGSGDTTWINHNEDRIGNGTITWAGLKWETAHWSGEHDVFNALYRGELGRDLNSADEPSVQHREDAIGSGAATLSSVRNDIAHSTEAATIVENLYADWGQGTPTDQQIDDGQTAIYGLSLAYTTEANWSQDQLAAAAAGYHKPSGDHWIQADLVNLRDQTQASALVADVLTNSWIDGAEDETSVAGILQQGGASLLNAAMEQATGEDAQAVVKQLNNPGCSDWQAFKTAHATEVLNSTIASVQENAENTNYARGIVWISQNLSAPFNQRLDQQGYPYENYVQTALGSDYVQTVKPYRTFDHWNKDTFEAVSDKTLDTPLKYYGGNAGSEPRTGGSPDRITVTMVRDGMRMANFETSRPGYLPVITQETIKTYRFQFAVPASTAGDDDIKAKKNGSDPALISRASVTRRCRQGLGWMRLSGG